MTKQMTHLDVARRDAQELHKKISANIARAEAATWTEVKAMQADAATLMAKLKTIADTEVDAMKADLTAAMAKLDAAAKLVEDKTAAGKDAVKRANTALLAASHAAAQSLSHAVANMRSKAAKAMEPKKVSA
jgi:hypothetical protein